MTLSQAENKTWGAVALRELEGKGAVHYAYFEPNCKALYIISDNGFKFTVDSENPIQVTPIMPPIAYSWNQSELDVTVAFALIDETENVAVDIQRDHITVKIRDEVFVSAPLSHPVDTSLTTWEKSRGRLIVTLVKSEEGMEWDEALVGVTAETSMSSDIIKDAHRRLSHLCSEIEVSINKLEFQSRKDIIQTCHQDEKVICE